MNLARTRSAANESQRPFAGFYTTGIASTNYDFSTTAALQVRRALLGGPLSGHRARKHSLTHLFTPYPQPAECTSHGFLVNSRQSLHRPSFKGSNSLDVGRSLIIQAR